MERPGQSALWKLWQAGLQAQMRVSFCPVTTTFTTGAEKWGKCATLHNVTRSCLNGSGGEGHAGHDFYC